MPRAKARGAEIYYEVHGSGDPLLIIPGFGSNGTVFFANTPALSERFRTVVMDPRGSGRSDVPPGLYTMQQLADDAVAVLDDAHAASAHVFAPSMGGMIAQHLALDHRDRIRRLVLACTTCGGPHHVAPSPDVVAAFIAAGGIADPVAAARSTYHIHYTDAWANAHDAEIIARSLAHPELRSTPEGRMAHLAAASSHDTYDRLKQIAAPTLVVHGEDDPLVPVANARILAARIPHARLLLYPRARHMFFVECAEQLNRDIISFLSRDDVAGHPRATSASRTS